MVWPTLGSRTAKEQNRTAVLRLSIIFSFVYAIYADFQLPCYQLTLIKRNWVTQTGIGWLSPWVVSFQ